MKSWIFQGKPSRYDIEEELIEGKVEEWTAYQGYTHMDVGDIVYFWRAAEKERKKRGIYGWGRILRKPELDEEEGYWVAVEYVKRFPSFIPFDELKKNKAFATHQLFSFAIGTNFKVSKKQNAGLYSIIKKSIGEQYLPEKK